MCTNTQDLNLEKVLESNCNFCLEFLFGFLNESGESPVYERVLGQANKTIKIAVYNGMKP